MGKDDELKIPRNEIFNGISKQTISALAMMTAKQVYTQGLKAGELVGWNAAIEAAANEIEDYDYGSCSGKQCAEDVRKLKK